MQTQIVIPFVYQLTQQELHRFDIEHYGAMFSIDLTKKENAIMIEKLQTYRAELVNLKAQKLNEDFSAEIEQKVSEYRAKLQTEYATQLEVLVAKIDNDIDCIDWLIKREHENTPDVITENTEFIQAAHIGKTILRG